MNNYENEDLTKQVEDFVTEGRFVNPEKWRQWNFTVSTKQRKCGQTESLTLLLE